MCMYATLSNRINCIWFVNNVLLYTSTVCLCRFFFQRSKKQRFMTWFDAVWRWYFCHLNTFNSRLKRIQTCALKNRFELDKKPLHLIKQHHPGWLLSESWEKLRTIIGFYFIRWIDLKRWKFERKKIILRHPSSI